MTNATSTSNPSCIVDVGKPYPYPSHFLAPNFVTMKLSGKDTYNMWETQILCLLKSHHMYGFIDGQFPRPAGNGKEKEGDMEAWDASNSLVKCWILGTLSDGVAKKVVNRLRTKDKKTDFSAKDLWDELQRKYGPWVVAETELTTRQAESEIEVIIELESEYEDAKSEIEVSSKSEDASSYGSSVREQATGEAYPYRSHAIGPNFVTVKLSSKIKYDLWRMQMECLIKSQHMVGFIDGQSHKDQVEDMEAWVATDSLVKGWILGSLSLEAVNRVVNHLTHMQKKTDFTAKDLWDGLESIYGPLAASSSNPSFIVDVGETYPYPSVIGPNFITMKLSGKDTYSVWETQILSLLWSQHMVGFIEGECPSPAGNGKGKVGDIDAWIASDSLVKGWILGSLSDGVAKMVINRLKTIHKNTYFTAKDLWDQLQHSYGPSGHKQAADSLVKGWILGSLSEEAVDKEVVNHLTHKQKNLDFTAKDLWDELQRSYGPSVREQAAESESESEHEDAKSEVNNSWLYNFIIEGNTDVVISGLEEDRINPWDKVTNNGNTVLHVAVGSSTKNHELLKKLLEMTPPEELLDIINSDRNSLLHVAATGGNTEVVDILVERNPELLLAKDKEGHTPLALSISNMHIKTSKCLFEHMKEEEYSHFYKHSMKEKGYGSYFSGQSGQDLVVLAISCQDFRLANMIINYYDAVLSDSDALLMALAQNFPRELNFWERRGWKVEYYRMVAPYRPAIPTNISSIPFFVICWVPAMLFYAWVPTMFYAFLKVLVRPFIEDTFQIHKDATNLLSAVCMDIFAKANSSTYHKYYTTSTFEATRRNTSTFIRCIMSKFPDAIWSTNEDGHNFIQYSVISRSEKIYNLLHEMGEHKNIYKTIKDSSWNNLLHLAARLAPANKLNLISGAALRIQRELQWFKEVEQFVCPLNRIQKNLDGETPQEVFTREHKDLVIEGENWIKKTAESYTITAALIITIVFAAAITVPGGNNQESGKPIFTNNNAFTVFAISNAISLFTAVTSLLLFLSILTARFAEQDFLLKLPTKLIIGLTMLFLSTTAMVIAFGATLFLVFGKGNPSMLIPIGALTCLPITSFVTLQFPLIVELIRATYCGGFFVRERADYFY